MPIREMGIFHREFCIYNPGFLMEDGSNRPEGINPTPQRRPIFYHALFKEIERKIGEILPNNSLTYSPWEF